MFTTRSLAAVAFLLAAGSCALGTEEPLATSEQPITNAATMSILQAKVAPDLQGRVFAAFGQINGVLTPLAYLLAGPLADRVFEPARRLPSWRFVAWAVGLGPGAGIGLMFVVAGALTALLSLAVYALPVIRRLEADLPDHQAADPEDP